MTLTLVAMASRSLVWELAEHYHWEVFERFFYSVKLPCVLDEFAMGICLALLTQRGKSGILFAALIALAIPVFKIYWANASYWHIDYMFRFWRSSLGLFFGLVLAIAVTLPVFKTPPLLYRALHYLGDISYGIYLWHLTIIMILRDTLQLPPPMLLVATLCIVLPLAALSWHGIEKPLIAYGKRRI
jgi:peptidoglycan/LPS O-acetylase OafA/YrhL